MPARPGHEEPVGPGVPGDAGEESVEPVVLGDPELQEPKGRVAVVDPGIGAEAVHGTGLGVLAGRVAEGEQAVEEVPRGR